MKKVMKAAGTHSSEEKFFYRNTTYIVLVHRDTLSQSDLARLVRTMHISASTPAKFMISSSSILSMRQPRALRREF